MAVGMAMAEKHLSAEYNKPGLKIVDNRVYVIVGDGDLMEGLSHEAASLAGHLQLDNLTVLYDSNDVTLDADTNASVSDNVEKRFESYGWNYCKVEDGNDLQAIDNAITIAKNVQHKPTLIEIKTTLGYGSPLAGNHKVHGNPLGLDGVATTKRNLDWNHGPFEIPQKIYKRFEEIQKQGQTSYLDWKDRVLEYENKYPTLFKNYISNLNESVELNFDDLVYKVGDSEAVRNTVHKLIQRTVQSPLNFWGGSADLSSSNKTNIEGDVGFQANQCQANNIYYGVREFAEAAAANGITLYGGSRTFTSTFFVFSDYMRNAMRLSALQQTKTLFLFSHDTIALGQDGPTHQPIEQLDSIRAMPGLTLFRPADAVETKAAWKYVLQYAKGPSVIAMSRQALPVLPGTIKHAADGVLKGGYIVSSSQKEIPDGIIMATGSEVSLAIEVQTELRVNGFDVSVVSMPCTDLFDKQSQEYKDSVLIPSVQNRMSIEFGSTLSWGRYTGLCGINIGIDRFGASGNADDIVKALKLDKQSIVHRYMKKFK